MSIANAVHVVVSVFVSSGDADKIVDEVRRRVEAALGEFLESSVENKLLGRVEAIRVREGL